MENLINKKLMTQEEKREQIIQGLADMMRRMPYQVEFKVKKKPAGIKVTIEVKQEEMDMILNNIKDKV